MGTIKKIKLLVTDFIRIEYEVHYVIRVKIITQFSP